MTFLARFLSGPLAATALFSAAIAADRPVVYGPGGAAPYADPRINNSVQHGGDASDALATAQSQTSFLSNWFANVPTLSTAGYAQFPAGDGNVMSARLYPLGGQGSTGNGIFPQDMLQWQPGVGNDGATSYCTSDINASVDCNYVAKGGGSHYFGSANGLLFTIKDPGDLVTSRLAYTPGTAALNTSLLGSSSVDFGTTYQYGSVNFKVNGQTYLSIQNGYGVSNVQDYLYVYGANSGNAVKIGTNGPDTNIPLYYASKGPLGQHVFQIGTTTSVTIQSGFVKFAYGLVKSGYTYLTPATGDTITMSCTVTDLVLSPPSSVASLTVNMCATPQDGQEVTVSSTNPVSGMVVGGNGNPINGTPTTVDSVTPFKMKYISAQGWRRV